jgi:hypothetical protein
MFVLRARLARSSGQVEPAAPASEMDYLDEGPPEVDDNEPELPPTNPLLSRPVKIRGRLSRRWTHNEQLMIRCCGIILSRATFFGSEALTSVKVSFLFSVSSLSADIV